MEFLELLTVVVLGFIFLFILLAFAFWLTDKKAEAYRLTLTTLAGFVGVMLGWLTQQPRVADKTAELAQTRGQLESAATEMDTLSLRLSRSLQLGQQLLVTSTELATDPVRAGEYRASFDSLATPNFERLRVQPRQ